MKSSYKMPYGSLVSRLTFCLVLLGQVIVTGMVFASQRHKGQIVNYVLPP